MTRINPLHRVPMIAALLMAAVVLLVIAPARAFGADDDKDWKVLGETKIKDAKDAASGGAGGTNRKRGDGEKKDGQKKAEAGTAAGEIDVSAAEGLVKRIKFEVRGADVEFKKITVTYENGDPEEVEVRDKVRRGGKSRAIDLKGGNRVIKKVLIAFKVDKDADRDARIVLMGHK